MAAKIAIQIKQMANVAGCSLSSRASLRSVMLTPGWSVSSRNARIGLVGEPGGIAGASSPARIVAVSGWGTIGFCLVQSV
jgi:hypothetical protein